MVDVTAHLEQLAAKNSEQLNFKTSIVDLLKLLDIDSSAAARRELAEELGAPAGLQHGSAEMNVWLHRTVLRKIADNGGNVPTELLD
jgi:8-oxo-dGTP pyrophosphatase MutT (NUDIX family)